MGVKGNQGAASLCGHFYTQIHRADSGVQSEFYALERPGLVDGLGLKTFL